MSFTNDESVSERLAALWALGPSARTWRAVARDAAADGVLLGALAYVLMQPLAARVFADRGRYTRHKRAWKWLMTAYNAAMCVFSLATCGASIYTLATHTGVVTLDGAEATAPVRLALRSARPPLPRVRAWQFYLSAFFRFLFFFLDWFIFLGASRGLSAARSGCASCRTFSL